MDNFLSNKELQFLNQLIANMYSIRNREKAFNNFLGELKDLVFFEKGDVYFYKQDEYHINFEDFIYVDWDTPSLNSYLETYCNIDDVLPLVANKQPIMFRSTDIFIAGEREKTQYYCELLAPAGMQYSIEGNLYVSDDGYVGGIGLHRSDNHNDFTQKDLEILKIVRPHLTNIAKDFCDEKAEKSEYAGHSLAILSDIKELGICIWDSNLKLIECNLEKSSFVPIKHREELIRSLITQCKGLMEKIVKKENTASPEERRMKSKISIDSKSYYADVRYSEPQYNEKGQFVAIVYDYATIFSNLMLSLRTANNLTDREFEILKYVINGHSNQEIASLLFISIPTVKKHLTSIYQKIGITGKSQLFNVVL
ncbi:hypothetical protein MASR2M70_01230 [Bacillota bacterium]